MALQVLLQRMEKPNRRSDGLAEIDKCKIQEHLEDYQHLIAYWRKYPDKFIDYLASLNPDNKFHFYGIQRVVLRLMMRYRNVYLVFSRGFSKSFLAVMVLIIKAILYPGATLATVAGQKDQSAAILSSKFNEIMNLIPSLKREVRWDTKGEIIKTQTSKDAVTYAFKNGSVIKNAPVSEGTRGSRFQSLLIEEVVLADGEKVSSIIMPTLVVSRKVGKIGKSDPNEVLNQSIVSVTSAGYKNTYAYDLLIDTLCHMVADKHNNDAFILGGDYRIPIIAGLQPADYIYSQGDSQAMDASTFEREYGSLWSGSLDGAYFNVNKFDENRVLNVAETSYNKTISKRGYYVMGVDVGRLGDLTEVTIIKAVPHYSSNTTYDKHIVNIYTYEGEHFELQAIRLKRLFNLYHCNIAVVDGNGIGAGLVDFLVRDQIDPDTDEPLWNWGVYNDDDRIYKQWITTDTIYNAMYIMKANPGLNSEMYSYCQGQLNNDNIKFLIDETTAKNKLLETKYGQKMTALQREEYLRPYVETSILKSQLANMISTSDGANVVLKRANERIKKDKVSSLIYGLYWIMRQEKKNGTKKRMDFSKLMLFTKNN